MAVNGLKLAGAARPRSPFRTPNPLVAAETQTAIGTGFMVARFSCPKMASRARPPRYIPLMTHPSALYSAYAARDPRFDGVFFIGVTSTGIYCRPVCTARTPKAGQLPILRERRAGGARELPAVSALPAGAGTGQRTGGRRAPGCRADRAPHRRGDAGWRRGARADRARVRLELAADPPRGAARARRLAHGAGAHAAAPAGQAAAHRNDTAYYRGGIRQRVRESPAIQRCVQRSLRHAAHAVPEGGRSDDEPPAASGDAHAAARAGGHPSTGGHCWTSSAGARSRVWRSSKTTRTRGLSGSARPPAGSGCGTPRRAARSRWS